MSINPLIQKPFSQIKNISFDYKDNLLEYKNTKYSTSEQFNFSVYEAFDNFNDLTVNNYSCLLLGKNNVNDAWLNFKNKKNSSSVIISKLKFTANNDILFLTFKPIKNSGDNPVYEGEPALVKDVEKPGSDIFFIEFISGTNKCYIKHTEGANDYYLYNRRYKKESDGKPVSTDDLWFTTDKSLYTQYGQFGYIINSNNNSYSLILYLNDIDSVFLSKKSSTLLSASKSNYSLPDNLERIDCVNFNGVIIDTGYYPAYNKDITYKIKLGPFIDKGRQSWVKYITILGGYSWPNAYTFGECPNDEYYMLYDGVERLHTFSGTGGGIRNITIKNTVSPANTQIIVNGEEYNINYNLSSTGQASIYMGDQHGNTRYTRLYDDFYSLSITENDELKLNYIPVRNKNTNTYHVYDTVSSQLANVISGSIRAAGSKEWINKSKNLALENGVYKIVLPTNDIEKAMFPVNNLTVGDTLSKYDIYEIGRVKKVKVDPATNTLVLEDDKTLSLLGNTLITLDKQNDLLDKSPYLNSGWVSYNDKNRIDINSANSAFDLKNQCLFHFEYNNLDEDYHTTLNIIPLKNHISPSNHVIRGDYMNNTYNHDNGLKPNVNFREYTTLETGSDQEFGTDNIILTYTFYDTEYIVNAGEDLAFTIKPNQNIHEEEPVKLDSILYPFIYLNINDTNFIKNGAYGSSIPFLADKVKKLQNNSHFINNGRYLYTWLFRNETNPYGIWLDRYYYPERISKYETLTGIPNIDPGSFNDLIDKDYIKENRITLDRTMLYFDKVSDLVFEKDTKYIYSRLDKESVDKVLDSIEKYSLTDNSYYDDNSGITVFDTEKLKNSGELDLSFDLYINPEKNLGTDIISNSVSSGFIMRQNNDITPFSYTFDNELSEIRLHNYNFDIIKRLSLSELFDKHYTIYNIITGKPFDNIIVLAKDDTEDTRSKITIFVLNYDLNIKKSIVTSTNGAGETTCLPISTEEDILYAALGTDILYILINNVSTRELWAIDLTNGASRILTPGNDYYWNGSIESKSVMESVYIDRDGNIYALPHYLICHSEFDGSLYGIRENLDDALYQVETIDLEKYKSNDEESAIFSSYVKITDMVCDSLGRLGLTKIGSGDLEHLGENELLLFDNTKKLVKTINLGGRFNEVFGLDAFKAYLNGVNQTFIGFIGKTTDIETEETTYNFVTIDENYNEYVNPLSFRVDKSALTNLSNINKTLLSNYSTAREYLEKDTLEFILNIRGENLITKNKVYKLKTDSFIHGWYNIHILINVNKGIFDVYLNNEKLSPHKTLEFKDYNAGHESIFNYPLTIGGMIYKNGIPLGDFLKLDTDTFKPNNVRLKNISAYSKILKDYEYQAVKLSNTGLEPIVLTLPAGQKNNIEEIIRYFKYSEPDTMSNSIRINIKNSKITDKVTQENLIKDIKSTLENEANLALTIKEINFI